MQIVSAHVTLVLFSLQCRLMHLTNSNVLNIYEMVSKTPGQLNANPFSFLPILYLSSFKLSQQFDVWSITGQSVTDFSLLLTRCVCVGGGGRGFRETKPFLPVVGFVYSVSSYIHVLLKTKDVTTGMKLLKNFMVLL